MNENILTAHRINIKSLTLEELKVLLAGLG
jgi:hypothetical protein